MTYPPSIFAEITGSAGTTGASGSAAPAAAGTGSRSATTGTVGITGASGIPGPSATAGITGRSGMTGSAGTTGASGSIFLPMGSPGSVTTPFIHASAGCCQRCVFGALARSDCQIQFPSALGFGSREVCGRICAVRAALIRLCRMISGSGRGRSASSAQITVIGSPSISRSARRALVPHHQTRYSGTNQQSSI